MTDKCRHNRDAFSEYLDGELDGAARIALDAHLAECADCRAELDALRLTVQAVAGLPVQQPRPLFAERVKAQLREEPAAVTPGILTSLWARALPVAAMLTVVTGLVLVVHRNGAVSRQPADMQLAMDRREAAAQHAAMPAGGADDPSSERAMPLAADAPEEARRDVHAYQVESELSAMDEAAEGDYGRVQDSVVSGEEMDNLKAEGQRLKEAGPQPTRARQARGAATGFGMQLDPPAAAPEPAEPALTWRGADALPGRAGGAVAGRRAVGPAAAREARKSTLDVTTFGARTAGMPADRVPKEDKAPVRVLLLPAADVADLAARTMAVLKARNLPTEVSFGRGRTGGIVEIAVRATPAVCDALARELLTLTVTGVAEFKDGDEGLVVRQQALAGLADDALQAGAALRAPLAAAAKVAPDVEADAETEKGATEEMPVRQIAFLVRIMQEGAIVLDEVPVRAARAAAHARAAGE